MIHLIIVSAWVAAALGQPMTPEALAERIPAPLSDAPFFMNLTCVTYEGLNGFESMKKLEKHAMTVSRTGNKLDAIMHSYSYVEDGTERHVYEKRLMWDGSRYWLRQQAVPTQKTPRSWVSSKKTYEEDLRNRLQFGHVLDGQFPGDRVYFSQRLKTANSLRLSNSMEEIDSASCYVLTAETDAGEYTLWIDPQLGFNVRKARILRDFRKHKGWVNTEETGGYYVPVLDTEVVVREFMEIDGRIVPKSLRMTRMSKSADDTPINYRADDFSRSELVLNPDFASLGAFKIDLPAGSLVSDMDFPLSYVWDGNTLLPHYDKETIELTNASMSMPSIPKETTSLADDAGFASKTPLPQAAKAMDRSVFRLMLIVMAFAVLGGVLWLLVRNRRSHRTPK